MKKVFNFTGEVFIIPNRAFKVKELLFGKDRAEQIAKANNLPYNEEDIFCEIWIVGTGDCATDNLGCHGTIIGDDYLNPIWSSVPVELLKNVKEGDTVKISLPTQSGDVLECTLRANQGGYRYSHRAPFERCLEQCCMAV